jgi:tripartite-type tricarboxylate transporter receptor subunit TctC
MLKKLLACLLVAAPSMALAQYPERVTRIVSPFSPGGGLDIVARLIAPKLSESYKQPVIVENRTGANGQIANDHVAKSPPDGYTLLIDTLGFTVHPAVTKNLPYDPAAMVPVAQLLSLPFVIIVNPKLPAQNVKELVELAKRSPTKLNFAQGGLSNRILGEQFRLHTNVDFVFVPYKGSNPATTAVMSGESDLTITDSATAAAHLASGRIRGLAVVTPERSKLLPDVPTVAEAGVPGYAVTVWYGVFAPAGTPAAVVKRLNSELNRIVMLPDVASRFATLGAEPVATSPEAFAALVRSQMATVKDVAERAKIQVQ